MYEEGSKFNNEHPRRVGQGPVPLSGTVSAVRQNKYGPVEWYVTLDGSCAEYHAGRYKKKEQPMTPKTYTYKEFVKFIMEYKTSATMDAKMNLITDPDIRGFAAYPSSKMSATTVVNAIQAQPGCQTGKFRLLKALGILSDKKADLNIKVVKTASWSSKSTTEKIEAMARIKNALKAEGLPVDKYTLVNE